jgi:DNA-binding beta-propeller fold protein YncE
VNKVILHRQRLCLLLCVFCLVGCQPDPIMEGSWSWGKAGEGEGLFRQPRAILADASGEVTVIDRNGYLQRFDSKGKYITGWRMPDYKNGTPTGMSYGADGRLWVVDTHYNRVLCFSASGEIVKQFGHYGTGEGAFIFPTDILFAENGLLYISEYGLQSRIQVFDASGTYLFGWGEGGEEDGQFNRPMSIAPGADNTLWVADSCNHRLQRFDLKGKHLCTVKLDGKRALYYPYGISAMPGGDLLVAEFGNSRVTWLGANGEFKGTVGKPGVEAGHMWNPWGVTYWKEGKVVFVADTYNNRVTAIPFTR